MNHYELMAIISALSAAAKNKGFHEIFLILLLKIVLSFKRRIFNVNLL